MLIFDSGHLKTEHERADMNRKCVSTDKAQWKDPQLTTSISEVGRITYVQSKQAHILQYKSSPKTLAEQEEPECRRIRSWS